MKSFNQYSPSGWTENGLSLHPEPVQPCFDQERPPLYGYLTKMAVSLIAIAACGIGNATLAGTNISGLRSQGMDIKEPGSVIIASGPSIQRVSDSVIASPTAVDAFEAQAQSLFQQLSGGAFMVPAETLRLAEVAAGRSADTTKVGKPDWVEKVALEIGKLTD